MSNKDTKVKIRPAAIADVEIICSFIEKKAEFDRNMGAFAGKIETSIEKICQTIFNSPPFAQVLFAEIKQPIGFALYYYRYSSFKGLPSIWLDDLYVDASFRNKKAGTVLMNYLAQKAKNNCCTHLAWTADKRNTRTISFYHRLGAAIVEQKGNVFFNGYGN